MYDDSVGVVDELSDILPSNNAGKIIHLPLTPSLILNLMKSLIGSVLASPKFGLPVTSLVG